MNILGTNIISSLGFTTEENFNAVKQGFSGVKHYDAGTFDLPESFMASLIDKKKLNDEFINISSKTNYTDLEKAAILSIFSANKEAKIDLSGERTIFVLSTTKGNVDLLDVDGNTEKGKYLWHSANLIADFFNNKNTPIIISNACISGAAAQIEAMRILQSGNYENVVVAGVDFLSKFIISGFQSFKALSPKLCKPFDKERVGLNLGEAAATIIFSRVETRYATSLLNGAIRNDSNHISAPSRTGEGSLRALNSILGSVLLPLGSAKNAQYSIPKDEITFINAHGTATPYNDAMETVAITRAGLKNVPTNSLKAHFGHTLGAAGVLESIISIRALEENLTLKSLEFNEQDFENPINISKENHFSDKKYFVKMMSGFGGVNAALLFGKKEKVRETKKLRELFVKKHIKLSFANSAEMSEFYRSLQVDYPKFFKMDGLSKLGFMASEMILKNEENHSEPREDTALICFNRSSSLKVDTQYQTTIRDNENYFPSPSLFVYTLPNIVTGEIAIRNKFLGETSFYVAENFDAGQMIATAKNAFFDASTKRVLLAWIENFEETYEVFMALVDCENGDVKLTEKNLKELYNN